MSLKIDSIINDNDLQDLQSTKFSGKGHKFQPIRSENALFSRF